MPKRKGKRRSAGTRRIVGITSDYDGMPLLGSPGIQRIDLERMGDPGAEWCTVCQRFGTRVGAFIVHPNSLFKHRIRARN